MRLTRARACDQHRYASVLAAQRFRLPHSTHYSYESPTIVLSWRASTRINAIASARPMLTQRCRRPRYQHRWQAVLAIIPVDSRIDSDSIMTAGLDNQHWKLEMPRKMPVVGITNLRIQANGWSWGNTCTHTRRWNVPLSNRGSKAGTMQESSTLEVCHSTR